MCGTGFRACQPPGKAAPRLLERGMDMSDSVRDLLVRGIAAAKDGAKEEAQRYLEWALRLDPTNEQCIKAWFWLSEISDDPAEKRKYLKYVLSADPTHPEARRSLAILDGYLRPEEVIDPNRLAVAAPDVPQPTGARQFVCPHCGGQMVYDPQGQLICEYCERRGAVAVPPGEREIAEEDFILTLATARGHVRPAATHCARCRSCGASFILPPETLSFTCPCAAVYAVEQTEVQSLLPPAAIIPFAVSRAEAERLLARWLKAEAPTAPGRVTFTGFYFPAWTFDMQCDLVKEGWDDGVYPTKKRTVTVNDVIVPASHALPESLRGEVECFRLDGLRPYEPQYLAGWPATTYQISPADASLIARQVEALRVPKVV